MSTLADWVAGVGTLVEPLVERLAARVRAADIVRTDATGLKVLDPRSPDHIELGSIWAYVDRSRRALPLYLCVSQLRDIALGRRNYLLSGSGIACDGHALWVVNSGEQSVTRLDPVGGAVLGVYKVGRCPLGATIAAGRLWVANSCSDSVSGVPLPLQFQ